MLGILRILKSSCGAVNVRTSVGVRIFTIATLLIVILAQAGQAGDWPMFRHDAAHTGIAGEVVEPPLDLLWKYPTGNWVYSSPAASGGVVYVGSTDNNIYALDTLTGVLKWKYTTGGAVYSSPAVSGGVVYAGSGDNNVYALDAATGNLKWKYTTGGFIESSPAVSGGVVFVGSHDNNVYALDAATGNLKWKYTTGGLILSSPSVSGSVVYVGSWDNNVYALDAVTGNLKWKYTTGSYVSSSPTVSNGVVYVGLGSQDTNAYALDAATGNLKWKYAIGGNHSLPWGMSLSSPAVSGGVVFVGSDDNNVYALDAATGNLKWKYTTGGLIESSPAVSGGVVYIGSRDNNIYALDAATGNLKWKYTTGNLIRSSPAISGGIVYVGSDDQNVYAFYEPILTIITVSPATASVSVGSTQTFTATPKDQFGKTMTATVTWSSSNTAVGTIDSNGLFTAKASGTTTVTAASGTVSGTASVAVPAPPSTPALSTSTPSTPALSTSTPSPPTAAPPPTSLTVAAASEPASIENGQTSVIKVLVTGTDNNPISGATVMLSASAGKFSPAFGTTDINGQFNSTFTGSAEGKVTFSAIVKKEGFIDGKGEGNLVIETGQPPTPTITPNQTPIQTITPTPSPVPTNSKSETSPIIPWYWILTLLIAPISGSLAYWYKVRKPKENEKARLTEDPEPEGKPAQGSVPFKGTTVIDTLPPVEPSRIEDRVDVKSICEYKCANIFYKVKVENNTSETIADIKVNLFVPPVFLLTKNEISIPMLEPRESATVTFEIRPTGECGDCNISGKIEYYDYSTKGHEKLDIKKKIVSVICPVLKRKEIDIKKWEQITGELEKAEENIEELPVPAENLFNIASRVIEENGMFMLKPEKPSTSQLFEGIARFYAEGEKTGLRYAAYIEVVGGAHKSRIVLRAWAEKKEALIGFYHRLLDGIEKRTDVKIFIDNPIVQYHYGDNIIGDKIDGDRIKMDKKIVKGGTGITAGGDVTFSDVTDQVAVGKDITQIRTLSPLDKKELRDCLIQFQKEINKLGLPTNILNTVNGDVTAAVTEVEKEKPEPSTIKNRFQDALDTMKDVGDTIEKVSKWTWTVKVIKILGKLGLSILL